MDSRYNFRRGYDTDLIILRSLFALDPNTNQPISSFYTTVADGIGGIQWLSPIQYFSAATGILNFVSSVQSFSTVTGLFSNFSTQSYSNFYTQNLLTPNVVASTISTFFVSSQNVTLSSLTFFDTANNSPQTMTFSSGNMFINSQLFYNPNAIYASSLVSTVGGLGTAGYISSSQFLSTIDKLGVLGYTNTSNLVSTTIGLNSNIVSTSHGLNVYSISVSTNASTIGGNTSNYAVTVANNAAATTFSNTTSTMISTVAGLGTAGYVSTSQLVSTTYALQNSFFVQNANNVYVNNSGSLTISSAGSIIFFSTFWNSSITYRGNNGQFSASNAGGATAPLYFSSATLDIDRWSTYINTRSIVTIEAYPTFMFGNLGLQSSDPVPIYMSSFIQSGTNYTSSSIFQNTLYPSQYAVNRSNSFYQPMKFTLNGATVQGMYPNSVRLAHYLPNAYTVGVTQGFSNSNVSVFFGSTNSLFLSIQNLPS